MWRANRLVDLLAKQAAAIHRLPQSVTRGLEACALYVRYSVAKLGVVTRASNHCPTTVIAAHGLTSTIFARDSEAVQPPRTKHSRIKEPPGCQRTRVEPKEQQQPLTIGDSSGSASPAACIESKRPRIAQPQYLPSIIPYVT